MASQSGHTSAREFRHDFIFNLLKTQQVKCINEINKRFHTNISIHGVKAELTERILSFINITLDSNNVSNINILKSILFESTSNSRARYNSRFSPEPARSHRPQTFSHVPLMADFRPPHPNYVMPSLNTPKVPPDHVNDLRTIKQIINPHKNYPLMAAPNHSRNPDTDLNHQNFSSVKFLRFKDSFFYNLVLPLAPHRIFKSSHIQGQVTIDLNLSDSNVDFLTSKRPDGLIPGIKLFCAPVSEFQKALLPEAPRALVKFPDSCELHINYKTILTTIRGKKNTPGSTRAPDIHPHIKITRETNRITLLYLKASESFLLVSQLVLINPIPMLVKNIVDDRTVSKEESKTILFGTNNDDGDLVATFELSLRCPVGFVRITEPFRSSHCSHAQCFDGTTFLQMNEQIETWACPVCSITIDPTKDLIRDGYFLDILQNTPSDLDSVLVNSDGSWIVKKTDLEIESQKIIKPNPAIVFPGEEDIIELSDSEDDSSPVSPVIEKQDDIIDLTETDDELDESNSNVPPAANQVYNANNSNLFASPNVVFPATIPYPQDPWSDSPAPGLSRLPSQNNSGDGFNNNIAHSNPNNPTGPDFNSHPYSSDINQNLYPSITPENNHQVPYLQISSTPRHFLAQPDPSP